MARTACCGVNVSFDEEREVSAEPTFGDVGVGHVGVCFPLRRVEIYEDEGMCGGWK